jgi:hypothetical protein
MADNEVIIDVVARLDKAEASLKKFESTAESSGESAGSKFGLALAAASAAAIAGIAFTFKKGIEAAIEQEDALNELNAALARTGQYSKEASASMSAFSEKLQKNSLFADDAVLKNAALIQSLGKLSTEGLKGATQAAADLAAGLRIDLRSASLLVGKAAVGEISTFSRYGIVIKEGATNAETFANALRSINSQFGGAAAAQINTFGGRLTQVKLAFGDLLEEVGNLIIKSPAVVSAFKFISEQIQKLTTILIDFGKSGGFERLIIAAIEFGRTINNYVIAPLEFVFNIAKIAFNAIQTGLQVILVGAVSLVQGLIEVASVFTDKFNGVKETVDNFALSATQVLVEFTEETASSIESTFKLTATESADAFLVGFQNTIANAPVVVDSIKNNLVTPINDAVKGISFDDLKTAFFSTANEIAVSAQSLAKTLQTSMVGGFTNAFAAVGGALVKGENAFAAFGKAILGALGQLLIQFGGMLIVIGAGLSTVPFLFGLQGPAAITAGAIAVVAGGALVALSGGGGGGASPAAGGSSSPSGTGNTGSSPIDTASAATQLQEPLEEKPVTNVTVNVQGNILDRRQTGLELADAINEAFSSDGIVIARGALV